jgi:hypothetical protein
VLPRCAPPSDSRSCGRSFFPGPPKLGAIHPHAMHDDRQSSRHSDDRALHWSPPSPGAGASIKYVESIRQPVFSTTAFGARSTRRGFLAPSPESSVSSMRLTQVESSSRNPSTPRRRCRHKSLTDRLKPSDACCPSCAGWTDTSAALPRGETERCAGNRHRH